MDSTLRSLFFLCCAQVLLIAQFTTAKVYKFQPEQVHLSFGEKTSDIVVTWSTKDNALESIVEYGIGGMNLTAKGSAKKFIDGGAAKASQYIHRVTLKNLKPKTRYVYHCGGKMGWSPEFWFKTPPSGSDWSPHVALFGDMGNENAQSLPRLQEDTQREMYDAIIHVGDFAYDMHVNNAQVGDEFMRQIESIAAFAPYMVVPGNHEERYNFSNYRARFSMPGSSDNYMYSFNLGPVHFIGFSTEVYYFMNYGLKSVSFQYDWLERDLKEATKPENRKLRPWIITYGHRPMYCSNKNDDDCTHNQTLVRVGLPFLHLYGLEKMFYKYGVDVEIWAHEHSYERYWPLYDYKVYNGSYEAPYTNPGAPIHLVTGSAGCKEGRENFIKHIPNYSAFHSRTINSNNCRNSLTENVSEIVVTWSTPDEAGPSIVEYGINGLILTATGNSELFVDGGPSKRSQYIHKVALSNLQPRSKYVYHCGGALGWSPEFWFVTPPNDTNWSPHVAIFGDMGNENAQSLGRLQQDTQRQMYDAIIHVGDFAYDMDTEDAQVGDEFMKQIEAVAAYSPYMVCPGNHEEKYNFSNYRARFQMPGPKGSLMYSFNLGPVHFISFSTEVYYFLEYGLKLLTSQYEWLENDLKEATRPENRMLRPWIVTYAHRPMYCSNDEEYDCSGSETYIRKGLPLFKFFGLEEMFYQYGVDVEIWAHEHFYSRLWPIYDFKVYNGSVDAPYTNPGAPVHIITGSAGCKEGKEPFSKNMPDWNAFHSQDYGYTRMKAHNRTHLYFEQVSDDKDGAIIDSFWIVKDWHGAYNKHLN